MRNGIGLLENNEQIRTAFRFMNLAMLEQQLHFHLPLQKWKITDENEIELENPLSILPDPDSPDTWYDRDGKIVFTNNRSLTGVGVDRTTFEKPGMITPNEKGSAWWNGIMKDAPAGYVFEQTITDDTQPNGPLEHTIRYVAPFDRCDREKDYETAWEFFSKMN